MKHRQATVILKRLAMSCALMWMVSTPAMAADLAYGSLKFEDTSHDFGDVYRGNQLVYAFKFVNGGQGPLTIQGVHAACGCTAVEIDKGKKYQPGESGVVEVKLDTTDFAGNLVKSITVLSNEKLLPDRTLTLRAFVKAEIEAVPPLADFGDAPSSQVATRIIRIKTIGGAKVDVKDLVYNQDVMTATIVKDGDGWNLTVGLKSGLTPSFLKETIIVKNTSTHLKELPIPVRANIKGNIDYAPAYLEFGAIAQDDVARRSLTMRGATDFNIVGTRAELIVNGRRIDDSTKFLKIDALPHEKDKQLVSIELKNVASVSGSVHGKLIFATSDPAQKELAVDFYAFFR